MWHENYDKVVWFSAVTTQFMWGPHGVTGFNYLFAYQEFGDMGLSGNDLDEWKWKLKVMESEALRIINRPEN